MGSSDAASLARQRRRARRRDMRALALVVLTATLIVSLAVGYALHPASESATLDPHSGEDPVRVVTTTTFLDGRCAYACEARARRHPDEYRRGQARPDHGSAARVSRTMTRPRARV